MAIFDVEGFRDYFLNLFQTELGAKITAINTEKADTITLETFVNNQYVNDMNEKVMNYNEFIFYGFPDISSIANAGYGTAQDITMSFEVVIADSEGGSVAESKIMRYTRALSEVIEDNMNKHPQISDLEYATYSPVTMALNTGTPLVKVGGISLKGSIG